VRGHGGRRTVLSENTYGLRSAEISVNLAESLNRRRTMQGQDMTANPGGGKGDKPKDDRHNPIEQSVTSVDPNGDPAPIGTPPRPPYDGPPGGGGDYERE
jgi:hypothetical protein